MSEPNEPSPIHKIATKHTISTDKPYFPVNTMRLFYLMITDGLTGGNQEVISKVKELVPKISAIFDARDLFLSDNQESNPLQEVQACRQAVDDIFAITNTPVVHHTFDLLFSDLYPLQENLLLALDRHLDEESLQARDLTSILKIRSMDAVVYSTLIYQVIISHHANKGVEVYSTPSYQTTPLHWQINIALQINDICDAVIYAKDDLEAGSATLIDILKKISTDPTEIEKIIYSVLSTLENESSKLPFPQPLQSQVRDFHKALISTIKQPPKATKPDDNLSDDSKNNST